MTDTETRLAAIEDAVGLNEEDYDNIGSPTRDAWICELEARIDDLEREMAKLIAPADGAAG